MTPCLRRAGPVDGSEPRVAGAVPRFWAAGRVIHETPALSPRDQVVDGLRVTLNGDAEVGTRSRFMYRFADAAIGKPIDNLGPSTSGRARHTRGVCPHGWVRRICLG